jgi:hypothetical protein
MSTRFLPTQESVLDNWLANFSTLISADPAAYGLSPADAAQIAAEVDKWHALYLVAESPETRTRGAVAAKRGQKKVVVAVVRGFAARVRANDAVSDELKLGLGLKLRPRRGEPVGVPASAPALALTGFKLGRHELRALDPDTRPSRGKPPKIAAIMVYRAVAPAMVNRPQDAEFLTLSTRVRIESAFTRADHGQTATYFARWINSKGEAGPWSAAMSAPIAA